MNKNNITLTVLILLIVSSCATFKAQYSDEVNAVNLLPNKEINRKFYLIGDAGKSPKDGMSLGLQAFNKHILNQDTKNIVSNSKQLFQIIRKISETKNEVHVK